MPPYQSQPLPGTQLNYGLGINLDLCIALPLWEGTGVATYSALHNAISSGVLTNTVQGATSGWSGGMLGGSSIRFDGSNDYVGFTLNNVAIDAQGTVSFWYASNLDNNRAFFTIGAGGDTNFFTIRFSTTDTLEIIYRPGADTIRGTVNIGSKSDDTLWHHVAYTGGLQGNRMYVDGKQVTLTYANGSATSTAWLASITKTVLELGRLRTSTPQAFFSGRIDNFFMWNRQLSSEEIFQLYKNPYCMFSVFDISEYFVPAAPPAGNGRLNAGTRLIATGRLASNSRLAAGTRPTV